MHNIAQHAQPLPPPLSPCMRPRHGEARDRILRAFDTLLRSSPAEEISMDAVAGAAQLSRRTVYNQFASKDVLYRASREALLRDLAGQLPREIDSAGDPDASLKAFLTSLSRVFRLDVHRELALSLVRDRGTQPWLAQTYRDWIWRPVVQAIQLHRLTRRQDAGTPSEAAREEAEELVALVCALACSPCLVPLRDVPLSLDRVDIAGLAMDWADHPKVKVAHIHAIEQIN